MVAFAAPQLDSPRMQRQTFLLVNAGLLLASCQERTASEDDAPWVGDHRPAFISLSFSAYGDLAEERGADSTEALGALARTDCEIARVLRAVEELFPDRHAVVVAGTPSRGGSGQTAVPLLVRSARGIAPGLDEGHVGSFGAAIEHGLR